MDEKIKVLIVDDSSIIRNSIEKDLKGYNIEVTGMAANGKEALEIFREKKPNVVTLDITMPEIDGLTVLEKMLKLEPATKVMIVTALSDKDTGLKAIQLGAKSIVVKPYTSDKLKSAFKKLIEK
jgi:two-component system chemotaxis response regulator CheY